MVLIEPNFSSNFDEINTFSYRGGPDSGSCNNGGFISRISKQEKQKEEKEGYGYFSWVF